MQPRQVCPRGWARDVLRYGAAVVSGEQDETATTRDRTSTAGPSNGAGSTARPRRPGQPKQPITVLFDRVMVQVTPPEGERRSRSGILIPATAQVSKRLSWAEAVAVGPNVRAVKPGDKVLYNPEDRFEVEVQGEEYVILRERDVHAVASERLDGSTGLYL